MGMLGSVVLILLGALANDTWLGKRRANLRFWLQAIAPLAGFLGIGATFNGLFCVVKMIAYLGFIRHAPTVWIGTTAAGMVSLLLGLRYGYPMLVSWLGDKLSESQRTFGDRLHKSLVNIQEPLGAAAIAGGTFCALINILK
jgi:ABC-type thiamin/hydroxymethylpyrimidine transport system permease subunit